MILITLLLFQIIGAIVMIVLWCKDGTMKHAALYGDNFEEDKPSDLVLTALIAWEIIIVFYIIGHIGETINNYFRYKYKESEDKYDNFRST